MLTFVRARCRVLVHWCFLVDTGHSMAALWLLWHYSVNNFTKVSFLSTTLWPVSAAPLFVGAYPTLPLQSWSSNPRLNMHGHSLALYVTFPLDTAEYTKY